MLNSQMGGLMRAEIDRQGIGLMDAVDRHRGILEAVTEGDLDRLRRELRVHYMIGFPDPEATAPEPPARPDRTGDS
jgi:DNA-binding GntR family transcriptional regulator